MKKAVVVISFGTSYNDTRKKTIDRCEDIIKKEFEGVDFFRAWTSKMIIRKIKKRDNEYIYYPDELFEKLYREGYTDIYIQSLHLICGDEYNKLVKIIDRYRDKFENILVGRPLLKSIDDHKRLAEFLGEISKEDIKKDKCKDKKSATVWMGHGSEHIANSSYATIDYRFRIDGLNAYVGTVEGYPEIEEVIELLKRDGIEKVHLRPMMLVAGDHATNDMASDEEDSWKSVLESNGFEVETYLVGLGEYEKIQEFFKNNLVEEVAKLEKRIMARKLAPKDGKAMDSVDKNGVFYGIGVGPGDSSLLTKKAIDTLKNLDVLYCPKAKRGMDSTAKKIVEDYLKDTLEIKDRYFPMSFNDEEKEIQWSSIVSEIEKDVSSGKNVGFITLGDPMVYSTYIYLIERLDEEVNVNTISGITSFLDISASNNTPLVIDRESVSILSGNDDIDKISNIIDLSDNIVIMKVNREFGKIFDILEEKNLLDCTTGVSMSSMENEKIYSDISKLAEIEKIPYFTTLIVNKRKKDI